MGYRSDVTYMIRFPSRKIAREFIRDLGATDSEASAGDAWCAICDEVAEWVDEN